MPSWLMTPKDGGEPHVAQTARGKRPADEGYDESGFTVKRLRRGMRDGERVIGGKVAACPRIAGERALGARLQQIGLAALVAELVDARLNELNLGRETPTDG